MFGLALSQVESALAQLHDVADARRVAFQARIKHLQKNGFPPGINTGKGQRASYNFEAVAKLISAFEFMQFGMMPLHARQMVEDNWAFLKITVAAAFKEMPDFIARSRDGVLNPYGDTWVWLLTPQLLGDLRDNPLADLATVGAYRLKAIERALWSEWRDNEEGFMPEVGRGYRGMLINFSWTLLEFFAAANDNAQFHYSQFQPEVDGWTYDPEHFRELSGDIGEYGLTLFGEFGRQHGDHPEA